MKIMPDTPSLFHFPPLLMIIIINLLVDTDDDLSAVHLTGSISSNLPRWEFHLQMKGPQTINGLAQTHTVIKLICGLT